jgi:hypothetical protein
MMTPDCTGISSWLVEDPAKNRCLETLTLHVSKRESTSVRINGN